MKSYLVLCLALLHACTLHFTFGVRFEDFFGYPFGAEHGDSAFSKEDDALPASSVTGVAVPASLVFPYFCNAFVYLNVSICAPYTASRMSVCFVVLQLGVRVSRAACKLCFEHFLCFFFKQINSNGYVSFHPTRREQPVTTPSSIIHSFPFTLEEEEYAALVAVFWADVDITGEGGGDVWYRTVTQHQDRVLLQRISAFARSYHQDILVEREFPVDLSFTWALIVTWDHVGYNKKHTDKVCAVGIHTQRIYMCLHCYTQKAV